MKKIITSLPTLKLKKYETDFNKFKLRYLFIGVDSYSIEFQECHPKEEHSGFYQAIFIHNQ